jgi:F-type H+-transporting ATPase subunit delta
MATTHAESGSIRYALALVEAVEAAASDPAAGKAELETAEAALEGLAAAWEEDGVLRSYFLSTNVSRADKNAAMSKLVADRFSPLLGNFLRLLQQRRRLPLLPEIAFAFRDLVDERLGRLPLTITTAVPVPEQEFQAWVAELRKLVGTGAVIEHVVKPEIIAGCIIRMGDHVADGSARRRLADLQKKIIERGTQHHALQS